MKLSFVGALLISSGEFYFLIQSCITVTLSVLVYLTYNIYKAFSPLSMLHQNYFQQKIKQ